MGDMNIASDRLEAKEKNIAFIRAFQNIKLKDICDREKVSRSNIYSGLISYESSEKVKNEIAREFFVIYGELIK